MKNHSSSGWSRVHYGISENPGCFDTGNGAIAYIDHHPDYPGLERVSIRYYATGRGTDHAYYRRAEDRCGGAHVRPGAPTWPTLRAARRALGI